MLSVFESVGLLTFPRSRRDDIENFSTALSNPTPPANPFHPATCSPLCPSSHIHSNHYIVILDSH
jgi:hypothetical protein